MLKIRRKYNQDISDEALIEKYRSSGDLELLGELYSRYMHLVYGVCMKYLQHREDARDAVMQIFEKLIDELLQHEVYRFKSWLYVLTKNYCLMEIRSKKTIDKRFQKWTDEQGIIMESDLELHPIDEDGHGTNSALKDCIENLKPEQKKCIQLFYFNSKCYREIAETLKIDEKKVKSHLQNAKRNLKICLENKNVEK